jgi:Na+-translocating ferredoxin:NAD+ oxidoreductase RnfG subunit
VNSCRAGGCSNPALPASGLETSEYFDYFVVFDGNLSIQQVKVYNYQATHGQEVTNKGWLKQFQGYNGERQLNVGKNIDAISGATVSVYAITNDIQEKTQLLKKIVEVRN